MTWISLAPAAGLLGGGGIAWAVGVGAFYGGTLLGLLAAAVCSRPLAASRSRTTFPEP